MKKDPAIFDANLARLLCRAYIPTLPAPAFRDRLQRTFLDEQARRGAKESPPVLRSVRRRAAWIAAAAMVVVASLVALRLLGDRGVAPGLEEIHAAGHVAVRHDPEGPWGGLPGDVQDLAVEEAWLEVATPPVRPLAMRIGDEEITAAASTLVVLEERPGTRIVRLARGGVDITRTGTGSVWSVVTAHGTVELGSGRLFAGAEDEAVRLHLAAGRAWVVSAAGTEDVPVGREVLLVAGRLLTLDDPTGPGTPPPPGGSRVAVDTPPADAAMGSETEPAAGATVRGRVGVEGEEEPVTSFVVAVLRKHVDNSYYQPDRHEIESAEGTFEVTGIRPGRYEIFVHAEGLALWRTPMLSLARGETVEVEASLGLGGAVRGLLVDPVTGTPVPGATVLSDRDAVSVGVPFDLERFPVWLPTSVRSAADGAFALSHLSPGEHVLRITAPGYAPLWTDALHVEEGTDLALGPLELRAGAAVEGVVTAADGTPAPDYRLIVTRLGTPSESGMDFGMAVTDLQGHFLIEDLPPGMLLAILLLDEEAAEPPLVRPFACTAGATSSLDFRIGAPGTRVHGILRDTAGAPVANRNLALVPAGANSQDMDAGFVATATNAAGAYAFEGVSPGRYVFLAIMDQTGDELLLVDELHVPDVPEVEHDLRLAEGRIDGRVTDAATGAPVAPCMVSLLRFYPSGDSSFAGQVRTDDAGRYVFPHAPRGTYRVVAIPLGSALGFETGEELVLDDARPDRVCDLALDPGSTARITVRDRRGRPLSGVLLVFQMGDGSMFVRDAYFATDAEGIFVLEGLRPGTYRVRGELPGYRDAEEVFTCRVTLETPVEITLHAEE